MKIIKLTYLTLILFLLPNSLKAFSLFSKKYTEKEILDEKIKMLSYIKPGNVKAVKESLKLPFILKELSRLPECGERSLGPNCYKPRFLLTDHPLDNSYLTIAVKYGQLEMVKLLLSYPGINVNQSNAHSKKSPLVNAIYYLEKAPNRKCKDMFKMRGRENLEIIQELLKHPAIDVNKIVESATYRPFIPTLNIAARENDLEVVKLFLAHPKIDIHTQDSNGDTILISLLKNLSRFINPAIIRALMHANAQTRDKNGKLFYELFRPEENNNPIKNLYKKVYEEYQEEIANRINDIFPNSIKDINKMISEYVL